MDLIRYQAPELTPWSAADRWSNLRDELNSFFELPVWSSFARKGQLFTGWSPALDLYQSNDNVIAVVELPGMRKEDIEISLHGSDCEDEADVELEPTDGSQISGHEGTPAGLNIGHEEGERVETA